MLLQHLRVHDSREHNVNAFGRCCPQDDLHDPSLSPSPDEALPPGSALLLSAEPQRT
jgi:hypothetical protein